MDNRSKGNRAIAVALGRNVRAFRIAQDLPKYELAKMAGISRPYLNSIERGTADARLSTVQDLAAAFGVSPFDLLSETPPDLPAKKARR